MALTSNTSPAVDVSGAGAEPPHESVIHPLYVRVTHWINALAVLLMIGSGWQIYNASPLFAFSFPEGSDAGRLAGRWLCSGISPPCGCFIANGLVYVTLGLLTGRFRRKLWPIRPADVVRDLGAALTGRLSHDDLARYNAVQKALYAGVLLAGVVVVASGFAIWKPVQLQELTALFGGYEGARLVHFFAMAAIVLFLVVHVVMAALVPRSLRAMIRGR